MYSEYPAGTSTFWQDAYLAAIRRGLGSSSARSVADEAVQHYIEADKNWRKPKEEKV